MRRLALAGATALLALAAPSALGATPVTLLPKAGCDVVADPSGDVDAAFDPEVGEGPNGRYIGLTAHNWDITGVSYRLSSSVFSVIVRVPGLQDGAARGTGDSWDATFVTRGKTVVMSGIRQFNVAPRVSGAYFAAGIDSPESLTVNGAATSVHPGVQYNKSAGFVVMSVDRGALEKATGGSLDTLTGLNVSASTMVGPAAYELDAATGATGQSVKATDNTCFV